MIRAAALLVLTVALLAVACARDNCGNTPWDTFVASLEQLPTPSGSCLESPGAGTQSTGPHGGTCAPSSTDSPCLTALKASCCAEAEACATDGTCACIVACRSAGDTATSCSGTVSQCGVADAVYDAFEACAAAHAPACTRLGAGAGDAGVP